MIEYCYYENVSPVARWFLLIAIAFMGQGAQMPCKLIDDKKVHIGLCAKKASGAS
jgi:hypothetical protein